MSVCTQFKIENYYFIILLYSKILNIWINLVCSKNIFLKRFWNLFCSRHDGINTEKFDPDCDNFSSCVKDKWKPRCCTLIQFFSNDRKKNVFPVHLFPLAPMHKNLFLHLYICQDIRGKNIRYTRYIIEKNKIYDFFFCVCFDFHVLSLLCIDFFVVLK